MSWFLRRAGEEHVVLERATEPAGSWRERWDSFRLVTPNWVASFPADPYDGPDPDGLSASLARADAFFDERFRPLIDRFIE